MKSSPSIPSTLSSSIPISSPFYPSSSPSSSGVGYPSHLPSSWRSSPSPLLTTPTSPTSHLPFENALNSYLSHETKENFCQLLAEVFGHGYAIDFELKGGSTLLHHAVSLNLERETALILNAGARILRNNHNKTPIDFALERGNQVILQLLRRSSDYYNYLITKNNITSQYQRVISTCQDSHENIISGVCKYGWSPTQYKQRDNSSIWAPSFHLTDIYDDYLDWKDRKTVEMLQELVDNLRETEIKFQNELEIISKEKHTCLNHITVLNKDLKHKEHQYCMKIWGTVEYERSTRKLLEIVSLKLIDVKESLTDACKKVFFFGEGHMRYYNGFVVKTSKRVNIRVTGSALQLGYVSQEKDVSYKTRSRIIPIDTIDEIEITNEVNSVSLRKSSDGRSPSSTRVSFTIRESNEQHCTASPNSNSGGGSGKIYFIFRFRNYQSTATVATSAEMDSDSKANLSPVLGVPMRTPPPPHPIVLSLDDSWGEIIETATIHPPEKVKEKGLFARAKARLSGKKNSPEVVATPSPPAVTFRAKSVAHEFFEALQCASMPDVHFYGSDHFFNRNRESSGDQLSELPVSSSPLVKDVIDWNGSNMNPSQLSGYGTSGLTSVESLLSSSHRTSSSYHTSRSSQSGSRMSFAVSDRDSLQSVDTLARSFPKNLPDTCEFSEVVLQKKKSFSSSYQATRSTLPLGRVVEEREDRSTSNDSSSLSHGSSQLLGLITTPEQFHDCVRLQHKEISKQPLLEDDEDNHDHDDWKSVGSDKGAAEEEFSRQYSLDSVERLVSITIDDDRPEKPPSLLTLSLQAAGPQPLPQHSSTLSSTSGTTLTHAAEMMYSSRESYSCPSTNYIPSAIEGYGPIPAPSPISSPFRHKHSTHSLATSFERKITHEIIKSDELSSSFPVDTILRHMSSRADASHSLSLFGESMTFGSYQDSEYLTPISLDPHLQSTQSELPPKPNAVSFKIPEDILENDDRLSCCSLPNPPRAISDGRLLDLHRKAGHSFSHADEVQRQNSPSKRNYDRSFLPSSALEPARHVAFTLNQEMITIREQRKDLEESLISCITERENLLQILHYLQSLRNALKHPPSAPSDTHAPPTSTRGLRQKFSNLSIIRSSRESSGELSTDSISSSQPDRNISHLSALLSAAVSNGMIEDSRASVSSAADAAPMTPIASSLTSTLRHPSREDRLPSLSSQHEGDVHLPSHLLPPSAPSASLNEAEEFVYQLLNSTIESSNSQETSHEKSKKSKPHEADYSKKSMLSLSLSQLIGPPPAALTKDYERGRDLLETLWHRDMIIFETVEKLAQCLYLREQAWQRLRKYRSLETKVMVPKAEDLYEVDLLS